MYNYRKQFKSFSYFYPALNLFLMWLRKHKISIVSRGEDVHQYWNVGFTEMPKGSWEGFLVIWLKIEFTVVTQLFKSVSDEDSTQEYLKSSVTVRN